MRNLVRSLSLSMLTLTGSALAGCGGGGSEIQAGAGVITITAFAPAPGGAPTPFTITGTNFETVTGTTAQIVFHALGGATPYFGGTSDTATVIGTVTSNTTITGTTPPATICGVASISIEVTVILESGVKSNAFTAGGTLTLTAPTVTGTTPASIPCLDVPPSITINGTGFGTGGTATVRFISPAFPPLLFGAGTLVETSAVGVVTSPTTITVAPPRATLTGVPTAAASIQVTLDANDSCSAVAPAALTYVAPTVTAFSTTVPLGGGANLARQTATNFFVISGTGFVPAGTPNVTVKFFAGGLRFPAGVAQEAFVPGFVLSGITVEGITPLALGNTVPFTATAQVFFEDGTSTNAFGPITFNPPPVVTDVATNLLVREFGAAPANRSFLTETETSMTITGSNFTAGAVALVYKQANGPAGPIGTGALTAPTLTVPTTIVGGSPIDGTIPVDSQAEVRVTNPDGQSGTFTAAGFVYRVRGHLQNTNVSLQGGLNSEMEAAVDPTNPRNLATLSHGTNGPGDVRLAVSLDAGRTWTQTNIGNAQDGLSAAQDRIDPRCAYDRFGNLYLCYFTRGPAPARTMIVLQSFDKGVTFPVGNRQTVVVSANTDKEFLVTGPNGANLAQEAIYVGWDDSTTSGIIVSGATCTGAGVAQSAYSAPIQIVDNPAGTATQFSNACVGPNGDLHVVWINLTGEPGGGEGPVTVQYDRNPLGLFAGAGFGADINVAVTNFGSFDAIPATPIRQTYCMPEVAAVMTGPSAGRVCITYGVENPDESNDADIVCRFTDNGGVSFSPVIDVNDDGTSTAQWQASVRADRATGTLVSAWYDSRNDIVNNRLLDIYASMSYDGGMTWQPNMQITDGRSDQSLLANGNEFLDYQGLSIQGGMALVTWADNSNSTGNNPNAQSQTENYASRFQFR